MENNKKPESNHLYHIGDKGTLRAMLILFLGPMPIYLSLIIVVMVWPEVLNALGLQAFVHYVTYDLQLDARLNLINAFPPCPPEFEVYFFHMQAASMLIIGPLLVATPVVVMTLARVFPDKFYGKFPEMIKFKCCVVVIGLLFLFLYVLYDLLEGPSGTLGTMGCAPNLYKYIGKWMLVYWLFLILAAIMCVYFITIRRDVFRK